MQQQLDQDLILNEEQEQEYKEFIFNFLKITPDPKFVLNILIRRLFFAQKALREELPGIFEFPSKTCQRHLLLPEFKIRILTEF